MRSGAGQGAPAYVGLGSNLGDRAGLIAEALALLARAPGIEVREVSPLYETEPWGYAEQPPFLNAVARLATLLGPLQVLIACKSIERQLGRRETVRWGPRAIDLDLLLYADQVVARRGLVVPHPRLAERAFVLVPLRDVHPGYRAPGGATIGELIDRLGDAGVRPWPAP